VLDLKRELQALTLSVVLENITDASTRFRAASSIYQAMDDHASAVFDKYPVDIVKTGNLDSKKLRLLLSVCSLDYRGDYQKREKFIDSVLCGRRHRIAHGGLEVISPQDLDAAIDGVLKLCSAINDQVIESLLYEEFLL
ncbi:MAE_28990/MAE_18760 family HEPN-like nuclease, partial [Saccharothrix longispora]|uniref:MAE_28990/MAE_18760 family HEPN-like nuclease n=1 Tax=Saccharothrix longispora TaxID=33920 RepID=UPI0028FDABDF